MCLVPFLRVAKTFEVTKSTEKAMITPTKLTGTTIAKTASPQAECWKAGLELSRVDARPTRMAESKS